MSSIYWILLFASQIGALNNRVGLTPPLGFNTWNHFACNISEAIIRDAADLIIKLKLNEVGYNYINIDDCWMASKRSPAGEFVPHPTRFPRGIKILADYIHQRGLKLGIYSSAGTMTCQMLPGSLDYEDIDARTWARWGIDYVKYDNCYHDERAARIRYTRMRDSLNATGRQIFYSICNWGEENLFKIGKGLGNSWRTTYDIENSFESMRLIFRLNSLLANFSGTGGWNDPDMLEIGNGKFSHAESRTHFALWAMAKSPLLLGCDLSKISAEDFAIISNKELIDLNQDPKGIQAKCALNCNMGDFLGTTVRPQIFVGELKNGDFALSVTNWSDKVVFTKIKVNFEQLKLPQKRYKVRDLWGKLNLGEINDEFVIEKIDIHDTAVFRLTNIKP